jgi:hypothetical protein
MKKPKKMPIAKGKKMAAMSEGMKKIPMPKKKVFKA